MPPLQVAKALGALKFYSHQLELPAKLKAPPDSDQYGKAWDYGPNNKIAIPQLMPPWFKPAEQGNKDYQDTCDKRGKDFKDFHDAMLDAVVYSHTMWKAQAKFQNIQINAVVALGMPGCLDGPELEPNIKNAPTCMSFTGNMAKHRDAVAKGVSKCFKDWQGQVTVPGLPWYPAFAAFPGPIAPPMPNVPTPLIACPSAMMTSICMPDSMKSEMDNALDGDLKSDKNDPTKQHEALHDAIATVLALAFTTWLPAQQVMLVLGKGPIPTFAPPYVPVGPVLMGDVISIPGHLAT
jgi:hypothetical protein